MSDSKYRDLFDLNFRYFENLRNLSAKYEAKINVSINCLSCSIAIWAITTTILFNCPLLPFIFILVYIHLSVVLVIIVFCGWIKGFSATGFKEINIFELNSDLNENFLKDEEQNEIYKGICRELLKGIEDLDKNLVNRIQSAKAINYLSVTALAISIILAGLVVISKINESYDFNIKSKICIAEYNNGNFNYTGAIDDNR